MPVVENLFRYFRETASRLAMLPSSKMMKGKDFQLHPALTFVTVMLVESVMLEADSKPHPRA